MDLKKTTHYRVNWIDGMKINKTHFVQSEDALISTVNQAIKKTITPNNYGLLPQYTQAEPAIDVAISLDGQDSIEVKLNACRAITLGGFQIHISSETKNLLEQSDYILKQQYTLDKEDQEWYIILKVNPYKTVPVGIADVEEEPPRHPYTLPEYKLDVLAKNETSNQELGLHHLTIGKIILTDGVPSLYEDFIPPCSSVQSHADLKFAYTELSAFLNQMEAYSMHIIQKIHQKKQTNDLAHMVLHLSQRTLQYLNNTISEFRLKDKYEAPISMISKQVSLARSIKSSLDVFTGTGKEDLLNYLTDWCDLNQGAFENVLIDMIDLEYEHTDINSALNSVSSFTRLMLSLFKKLNELDYIGKKSDSNIFVKEEAVENPEVKSRRSFLLD